MIGIRGVESGFTCCHIPAHVGTCWHISIHVGMSIRTDTRQHGNKVQMVGIRDVGSDATCWHISTQVGTHPQALHTSARVGMSLCADTCQHGIEVQMVGIRGAESDATCRHMSAHFGMPYVLTHGSMHIRSKWFVSEVHTYIHCICLVVPGGSSHWEPMRLALVLLVFVYFLVDFY